jgi:putative ABC transport system ATP-binding protein
MAAFIEIRDLGKAYRRGTNEVVALDRVSLDVAAGEFLALMGPSGSGKTTLLNIVAGVDRADRGSVTVDGVDLAGLTESEKTRWRAASAGYIFQFYNLIPVLTAYENVELPLLVRPLSRKERRDHTLAALEAVGLLDRQDHLPRQLSGGQEQRVAIARAIVTDPKLIVADEPTGNLDAGSEQEIMTLLKRLNKEFRKTMLMVTHDTAAAAFADRTVRLEKSRLCA